MAYLENLILVVACVDGIATLITWVRVQLTTVNSDGLKIYGTVGRLSVRAVLPLHNS